MSNKIEIASVLAFERKLDPSDGLFFGGNWGERDSHEIWQPLSIREKSVRGTISNRLNAKNDKDPAKLDAAIEHPNPQTVDVVTLPPVCDTLKVQFSLRVLGRVGEPSACNRNDYRIRLKEVIDGYKSANDGFGELARRYSLNLANGRFLWRNRIGAENIEVLVSQLKDGEPIKTWRFDALAFSLNSMSSVPQYEEQVSDLAKVIESGLSDRQHVLLQIIAFARMGAGQEVFPSQEMILDRARGDKSKTLYEVGGIAAMHSQKIGNAIRTIDTWYPGAEENGPIAVEPYGSVTTQGKAWRQPKEKVDFYTLFDGWVAEGKIRDLEQQHFVVATLIRGGVFGRSGD